jgi:transposase
MRMDIEEHYGLLLGIHSPWEISLVDLSLDSQQVDIHIEYADNEGACPECGTVCPKHDDRNSRTWRHLDTMQFSTLLHCQLPRIRCKTHGVKSLNAPWAGKNSRFTLLFEAFAIRVLKAARSVKEASLLLGLNWHQVEAIKARAVARGLKRREDTPIHYIGIDEKQFRTGHRYISSLVDLEGGRVLEVVEGRTEQACKALISQGLSTSQQPKVKAVALDMWKAYANAVREQLPQADIVHDRFHISQHLNMAVNMVRKSENKKLVEQGDNRLKGSKFLWLINEENQKEKQVQAFGDLKKSDLKVARAWAIKELFRQFWSYSYKGCALRFFNSWYAWAIRSRLTPIKQKAKMIKSHLTNILTYFEHGISNAVAEGLNSKIQTVKSNARGYRSFLGFRNSILFYCGGLSMAPQASH